MPLNYVRCAARGYLARHGAPREPRDLGEHHGITGTEGAEASWLFNGRDGVQAVSIYGRLQVNNALLRCDAARAGVGILLCADYLAEEDLASGRLVRALPEHRPAGATLHAVSPAFRAGSPKVRSLVNHLSLQLGLPAEGAAAGPTPTTPANLIPVPDFHLERRAGGRVAGLDEAGRGPLAGPVVAAAVVFPTGVPRRLAALLDDSKKLTAEQRLTAFASLRASGRAEIGVGAASVAEIERLNILHAALLAMARAVARLPAPPDLALVDGNQPPRLACPVQCVVGGDGRSLSIAAASIVAKVLRDRAMALLGLRFPDYGWGSNAGYATELHLEALRRLGPTRHHRPSFGSVAQLRLDLLDASDD